MKKLYLFIILSACIALNAGANGKDTVFVSSYGIRPDSYTNCVKALQTAIEHCRQSGTKVLAFEKGRYDFWPEGAVRKEFFITNTSTEQECPSKVKTFGMFFEDMENLVIEGNGATLVFHGKMTMLSLVHCRQIKIKNLQFDFERPGGSEITYADVNENGVDATLHPDTRYDIVDGHLQLIGEGWRTNIPHCIEYDPENEHFFFSNGWSELSKAVATETAPGKIHFNTSPEFRPKIGNTLTVRDIIRDQVGLFLYESSDIVLKNVAIRYMHGLGIVSQYTRNITMDGVHCTPAEDSGRILASSADFMHFSGCSGKINIFNCRFIGAQDDPINVHGTNLRAVRKLSGNQLVLRFMHGQSYGFNAYFKGDTVAFIHSATMERFTTSTVKKVKRLSDREISVTFGSPIPEELEIDKDCVENISCTPEVEIRHCYFTRTSTRGTLMTTPRKVIIADNVYYKTGMSAILIEGDAEGWYESGPVKDVLIQNNTFIDCAYNGGPGNATIALHPSNKEIYPDKPVHTNVRIIGNKFHISGRPVLYAKSTAGLSFNDNVVALMPDTQAPEYLFILNGCKDVDIKDNLLPSALSTAIIKSDNMKEDAIFCVSKAAEHCEIRRVADFPVENGHTGLAGAFAGNIGNSVILAGGSDFPDLKPWEGGQKVYYDDIYIIDSKNGEYRISKSDVKLPCTIGNGCSVSDGNTIFCFGGNNAVRASNAVYSINYQDNKIQIDSIARIPDKFVVSAVAFHKNGIYAHGTTNGQNTFYMFSPVSGRWTILSPVPEKGVAEGSILVSQNNGNEEALYLMGGRSSDGNGFYLSSAIWEYSPATDSWSKKSDIAIDGEKSTLMFPGAMRYGDDKIFVFGGDDGKELLRRTNLDGEELCNAFIQHPGFCNKIFCYNTLTNSWSEFLSSVCNLPAVAANAIIDGKLLLICGEAHPGVRSSGIYEVTIR